MLCMIEEKVNMRFVGLLKLYNFVLVFFFFFQAEDGIRDLTVTGVQTCALPISRAKVRMTALSDHDGFEAGFVCGVVAVAILEFVHALETKRDAAFRSVDFPRSEERRVGKECRFRWSPYH